MTGRTLWGIITGTILSIILMYSLYVHMTNRPIYAQSYSSVMMITPTKDVILTGACVKMAVKLEVRENAVTLSVGHDRMSGVPVNLSESGELSVKFSDDLTIKLVRIVPQGYEHTKDNELLLVIGPDHTLILSHYQDCEEITSLVEQLHERELR
jgi:hypothetical protein